ncbi:MAG: hypothetical protein JXR68_00195 [Bacteroidales bacterium]|nr:hypothetical protein [Bacteroidales bacterium]
MNKKTKRFLIRISIMAIIMLLLVALSAVVTPNLYTPANFVTVLIFYFSTIGVYLLTLNSFNKKFKTAFVNIFMAGTIAKLFTLLMYLIIYLFAFGNKKAVFLIFVLINYVPFTFFEVFFILKNSSKKIDQEGK